MPFTNIGVKQNVKQRIKTSRSPVGDFGADPTAGATVRSGKSRSMSFVDRIDPARRELARSSEAYWQAVAEAAYYKAEKRHFVGGFEEQDWLEAEREVVAWMY